MTLTEFLLIPSVGYQADKKPEIKKMPIRGLLVDPIPNSPN